MNFKVLLISLAVIFISACASKSPTQTQTAQPSVSEATASDTKVVKSIDGTYTGEIVGIIEPNSKFAKLKIGMEMPEVHALIKAPDDMQRYQSGKGWIPFYFGNDAFRVETYYAGEGCLTYTGGGSYGGTGGQLIRIKADKTKHCFNE
jgi:hypothetical protein